MNKKPFLALFVANLATFVIGAGALPLLPVYAAKLGAPPAVTGYYLALAYLALTVGKLAGGWLSDRCRCAHRKRRRTTLAMAGLPGVPAVWAMGRVGGVWALTLSTCAVWFLGGMGYSTTQILAGLLAGPDERGKVYGTLSMAAGSGSLIGGLITGPIVDRWGYPTMFALLSLFFVLWPAAALVLRDRRADQGIAGQHSVADGRPIAGRGLRLGKGFYTLFAASLVASVAGFVSVLGRSLSMNALGYTAAAISSTGAVSSALTLALPPLIGRLSDRGRLLHYAGRHRRRKRFLVLSYLVSAAALVSLSLSSSLWHFMVAVSLGALSGVIGGTVGPALVADRVPRASLGRGLGLYSATSFIGAVIGFAGTGTAVQRLGLAPTTIAGAALPLISVLLLVLMRQSRVPSGRPNPRLEVDPVG